MLILAIAHLQPVSGKTTATCRLANALVQRGSRVLLLDLDPEPAREQNLSHVLRAGTPLAELSTHALFDARDGRRRRIPLFAVGPAIALLPISTSLLQVEDDLLYPDEERLAALQQLLHQARMLVYGQEHLLRHLYDICLIDCASLSSSLTMYAIVAAQSVLVPQIPRLHLDSFTTAMTSIMMNSFTKRLVHAIRSQDGASVAEPYTDLRIPYDPRLDPARARSLGAEEYALHARNQQEYWKQLAEQVTAQH